MLTFINIIKEDKIETKDPVHLEIARDQARKDLALAREELATIKAGYNDVVPRKLWETAENNLKDANQELEALRKDLSELSRNFSVLKSTYDSVEKERNEVVIERNELKRTGTPRYVSLIRTCNSFSLIFFISFSYNRLTYFRRRNMSIIAVRKRDHILQYIILFQTRLGSNL